MKKISVIIVNYNVCYFLEQTLRSVYKALNQLDAEVFVVDNCSVDGSVEMVKAKFPKVSLIENAGNVGFSRANNQAIRQSSGEYILLLNPDTVIQEDTLTKCCSYMDGHTDVGGLGVYMVDGKGNFLPESKRGLPTPWVAFYKIVGLSRIFPRSKKFGRYHLGYLNRDQIHEVDVLSGAFMLMRKEMLDKIGLLDEDYFMYGEDIDLSYRISKAGYKNIYFPDTRIIHYKGESTKKSTVNYVLVFYGAMIIFAKKHFSGANAGIFSFIIQLGIYARALVSVLIRAGRRLAMPIANALLIFVGFAVLKNYWEFNFKLLPGLYPPEYLYGIVPVYIFIWLVSVYYSGGFDKPYHSYRVVRGVFVGTILISSISNFFDEYRFSKALIILGGIWCMIAIIGLRYLIQMLRYRRFNFDERQTKKVIVIGSYPESSRVMGLIKNTSVKVDILGFISTEKNEAAHDMYLGDIINVREITKIYKPDEIIFCSKNMMAGDIISLMSLIDNRLVEFKIVPDESNYIIGSSSKDSQGELYTMDVHLSILDNHQVRNKRVVDVTISLIFIITLPLSVWLVPNPKVFISRLVQVLLGKYSFVGFGSRDKVTLPKIKEGILSPVSEFEQIDLDNNTIRRLDLMYAKDYRTSTDLNIIFNSFRKLGVIKQEYRK